MTCEKPPRDSLVAANKVRLSRLLNGPTSPINWNLTLLLADADTPLSPRGAAAPASARAILNWPNQLTGGQVLREWRLDEHDFTGHGI